MANGNILIVEDSPDIREVLNTYLSAKGYQVKEAAHGLEAMEKLKSSSFDLIISDINMPFMDGLTFLDKSKELSPETPFVLITGFPTMENAVEAIRKGAADYITKPFNFNQIDLVLERLVKKKEKEPPQATPPSDAEEKETIKRLNDKLNQKVQELSKLYYISESIYPSSDEEALFSKVVEVASQVIPSRRAYLLFRDGESGEFYVKTCKGLDLEHIDPQDTKVEGSVLLEIIKHPRPIISTGRQVLTFILGNNRYQERTFLLAPLSVRNELFGAIVAARDDREVRFSQDDELLLMELSRKVTLTLENSILYHTLYMHFLNTLKALVASVEAKDRYTERHSQRVTYLAKKIAMRMGCSPSEIDSLEFAGLLHDIGKIGVSDVILQKQAPLTEEEWKEIRRHPEIGEEIVKSLQLFPLECAIIRHHHERWDGKGYPDGLKGTQIPLLARIISVADSFDAIISHRPYRPGKSVKEALEELKRCRGTQFDPQVVDAFVEVMEEKARTHPDRELQAPPLMYRAGSKR